MARKWTKEEIETVVEYINKYPGNYTYAARQVSPVINRSVSAILIKFREKKWDYKTPVVVSPDGIKTPNGIPRWCVCPPTFEKIRRWNNIKHLFFN